MQSAFAGIGNPNHARTKRVYYEGTSTIYEGMPVCYNYDTTDNIAGRDTGNNVNGPTTAEGYQNEGKYMRVEDPNSENLQWFAGVVKSGDWVGKTGPDWLDIYVANGAIVPVRAGIACYAGSTVLAIQDGSQSLEQPKYGTASATVAIAEETVDRTTDGIVLAKLLPVSTFNQGNYDVPLRTGDGVTTGEIRVFESDISTHQTGGEIVARVMRTRLKGDGSSCPNGGALLADVYVEGSNDTPGGRICAFNAKVHLDPGCTITGQGAVDICAAMCYLSETAESGATRTGSRSAALLCYTAFDDENAGALLAQIAFMAQGTDKPDVLFYAVDAASIAAYASTSDAPALATGDIMIPIQVGGDTYYLVGLQDSGI